MQQHLPCSLLVTNTQQDLPVLQRNPRDMIAEDLIGLSLEVFHHIIERKGTIAMRIDVIDDLGVSHQDAKSIHLVIVPALDHVHIHTLHKRDIRKKEVFQLDLLDRIDLIETNQVRVMGEIQLHLENPKVLRVVEHQV